MFALFLFFLFCVVCPWAATVLVALDARFDTPVNRIRLLSSAYEQVLFGMLATRQSYLDKRDPRATEIASIKQQIRMLEGNTSDQAKGDRSRLNEELKTTRQEYVDHEIEIRRLNDLAKYQLQKPEITTERELRAFKTRLISKATAEELEARHESYELE